MSKVTGVLLIVVKYLAYLAGIATAVWLSFSTALQILLIVMVLDIVAGSIRAGIMGQLNATAGFAGVGRKVLTLIVIGLVYAVGGLLDKSVATPLIVAVIGYYCYVEVLSVITNAAAMVCPVSREIRPSDTTLRM